MSVGKRQRRREKRREDSECYTSACIPNERSSALSMKIWWKRAFILAAENKDKTMAA